MDLFRKIFSMRRFSFLLSQLVRRDFKVRYRGSMLGVLWSVLNPLFNMIVLSIVFGQVFKAVDNYKMYLLSGLVLFNFFSEASNMGLMSVVTNFGLITKVYFPKLILPLSKVLSSTINLVISFFVFIVLGLFMGVKPWIGYFLIIYVAVFLILFSIGISFILATLQVFFRDMQHLYSVLLTIWMYATPILYPIDIVPEQFIGVFKLNPMYSFVDFFRQITLYGSIPTLQSFGACAAIGIGFFVVGGVIFVKSQKNFIYYS